MSRSALAIAAALSCSPAVIMAQAPFGTNLIVNGDAEAGPGSGSVAFVASIPGWTNSGANVLTYASDYGLGVGDILPATVGKNYFSNGTSTSSMSQVISIAAGAGAIDAGTATFAVSGYLGGYSDNPDNTSMTLAFADASNKQLSSMTLGPVNPTDRDGSGLYLRRRIGPVPVGARSATVTVNFTKLSAGASSNNAYADNLSLVLNTPLPAARIYGANLILNGDAEAGLPIPSSLAIAPDLPNWVRTANFTTDTYGASGADLDLTTPAPPDRGKLYFYGGPGNPLSSALQDIDISSVASAIDAGGVQFNFAGWIGGYAGQEDNATVTLQFMNWTGGVLGTSQLGPVSAADRGQVSRLIQKSAAGTVPAGARLARVTMVMTRLEGSDNDGIADSLTLLLAAGGGAPAISPNGVATAAAFSGSSAIAPGTWIEIYGNNLGGTAREWAGSDYSGSTAPTVLDGVRVTIGGQLAFVRYISPGQVNAQVPSNVSTGQQSLVVSTAGGSSQPYPITVNATQPGLLAPSSFIVGGKQYVAALFPDGSTFVLPPGTLPGVTSRQAKPGDTIIVYGVGFGPTTPAIAAGQVVAQSNTLALPLQVSFGGTAAKLSYSGLAPSFVGLDQFNIVVPQVANSDLVPLTFSLGGTNVSQTLYIAVHQ